jgi:hypothetical protein
MRFEKEFGDSAKLFESESVHGGGMQPASSWENFSQAKSKNLRLNYSGANSLRG